MKKVVIMEPFSDKDKKAVANGFENAYEFTFCENEIPEEILKETEIIIGQASLELIQKAPKLEWVQGAFAGVDNLLKQGDFPENIILTNVTGAFGISIAEHMMAMILTMYKKLDKYLYAMESRQWIDLGQENTLFGKTVLVIGTGDIGTTFAKLLKPFCTYKIGIKRTASKKSDDFEEIYAMNNLSKEKLKELISKADIVAMSVPSTTETRGFMDYELLSCMKENAMIINVGRGDTLVTEDLIKVLNEKESLTACLDVVYPEPLPQDNPLWKMKNVFITPHISGGSFGHLRLTEEKIINICRENLTRYLKGEKLFNVIDLKEGYVASKN